MMDPLGLAVLRSRGASASTFGGQINASSAITLLPAMAKKTLQNQSIVGGCLSQSFAPLGMGEKNWLTAVKATSGHGHVL